ncbi:MAG: UbiA family prenyltransferase [Acidobacteriota bacterium]
MQSETVPQQAHAQTGTSVRELLSLYMALGKARLSSLVVLTTVVGYITGAAVIDWPTLLWTTLGTALLACGANGLNQWMELDRDAQMERTRSRPIPSGRLTPDAWLPSLCVNVGFRMLVLGAFSQPLTALPRPVAAATYLIVYTPLKSKKHAQHAGRRNLGRAASCNGMDGGARHARCRSGDLVRHPLRLAGAALLGVGLAYREDYERGAGVACFRSVDRDGRLTGALALVYSLALIPIALAGFLAEMAGGLFAFARRRATSPAFRGQRFRFFASEPHKARAHCSSRA